MPNPDGSWTPEEIPLNRVGIDSILEMMLAFMESLPKTHRSRMEPKLVTLSLYLGRVADQIDPQEARPSTEAQDRA